MRETFTTYYCDNCNEVRTDEHEHRWFMLRATRNEFIELVLDTGIIKPLTKSSDVPLLFCSRECLTEYFNDVGKEDQTNGNKTKSN
jgi:hypothetical protein